MESAFKSRSEVRDIKGGKRDEIFMPANSTRDALVVIQSLPDDGDQTNYQVVVLLHKTHTIGLKCNLVSKANKLQWVENTMSL